jgi:predicted DNA-binding protein
MANADTKNAGTMIPVSGRLPEELYQWLSTLSLEGATTVSDRIRIAVATLKRLHDGDSDYMGALGMQRDLVRNTRVLPPTEY